MKRVLIILIAIPIILCGCRIDESDPVSAAVIRSGEPPAFSNPETGIVIYKGSELKMKWLNFNVKQVRLELLKKKLYNRRIIVDFYENNGAYNWVVPPEIPGSVSYQVKLVNINDETDFIYSPVFEIR
jgi:hypothetical protein